MNGNYAYAVDLSDNNGASAFDAKAYKAAGHQRIILKATQGIGEVDSCFHSWAVAAQEVGLWVSAYHFADNSGPAADQAAHFTDTTRGVLLHHRILDAEQGGNLVDPVAFRQEFGRAADILYSDAGYLEQYGEGLAYDDELVWVAAYPNMPSGWWSHRVWGHQYSETARVAGIAGQCDISFLL